MTLDYPDVSLFSAEPALCGGINLSPDLDQSQVDLFTIDSSLGTVQVYSSDSSLIDSPP